MRRWLVYLAAFALAAGSGLSPFSGTDVGKLLPVETVRISGIPGEVRLETDTGDVGIGNNAEEALADLKAAAPGNVFLETADYLLVAPGSEVLLETLYDILRPNCGICIEVGNVDLKEAGIYLAAHEPTVTLQDYHSGKQQLPILKAGEERMELVQ